MTYYIVKADKTGLVAKKVQVRGKTKVYQAIRWIAPEETKKRVKQFIKERERQSKHTRYMKKHPENIDVVTQAELIEHIPPNDKGNRYFYGVDVKLIDRAVMVLDPKQYEGLVGMIVKNDGTKPVMKYSSEHDEKNGKKKHIRSKRLAANADALREDYYRWMKGSGKKCEVGICLALMDIHEVRVGGHGAREDHFGSTTLEGQHVLRITSQDIADKLAQKISDDRLAPVIEFEKKAQVEPDPVKKERMLKSAIKKKEEANAKINAIPKPKVGDTWLDFLGKSSVQWSFPIEDAQLRDAILKISNGKKPNEPLFKIDRTDVARPLNKYKIIPKDFRSYHGTKAFVEAAQEVLDAKTIPKNQKELKSIMKGLFKKVSGILWNQPGVAKSKYVDPVVALNIQEQLLAKMGGAKINKGLKFVISERMDRPYA